MTKEEILEKTTWDYYIAMGTCPVYVPLFEKEIPFIFFQDSNLTPSITEKMFECVKDILALEKLELETIKEMLWEECYFAFSVTDYGCEPIAGETDLEANFREFGISNKEDAYSKSEIIEIQIAQEYDTYSGRYAEIKINSASDNLISIIVKNGKIIDFDDDGTNLGSFEEDEQYAKKAREKTLKT